MSFRNATLLVAAMAIMATPVFAQDVCQVAGNYVNNCGFEYNSFAGWTLSGNTGSTGVTGGAYAYSGSYGAYLGPVGSDGYLTTYFLGNQMTFQFRQDPSYWGLDSVIAEDLGSIGGPYNLWYVQFALANFGGTPNDFTVLWDGTDVGPSLVNSGTFPYTIYSGYLEGYSTPEPGSLILMGSGVLGLAGLLRRKLNF